MSTNSNLARLPAATMSGVLHRIAAGLRGDTCDVLDLRVHQVCLRTISMIRESYPMTNKALTLCVPIALLGYGIYEHVMIVMKMTSTMRSVYSSCLCSLTVAGSHDLNKLVLLYLSKQGIGQDSRSLAIAPDDPRDKDSNNGITALKFLPTPTTEAWFKFNGKWLKFSRAPQKESAGRQFPEWPEHPEQNPKKPAPASDLTLSCFSLTGNSKPIKDFLEHVQHEAEVRLHATMRIVRCNFDLHYGTPNPWKGNSITRPTRKLDSVSMSAATKKMMIDDMTSYLNSETYYAERGIPWRRGYLFFGPPGTGKTSIATAIAGHFNIPLHLLSLSDPHMCDKSLQTAFDYLPRQCVILIEDIDSAGIAREKLKTEEIVDSEDDDELFKPRTTKIRAFRAKGPPPRSAVTLSGFLNAIDGVGSHEGRILVATTNSPNNLDPALIRNGRIDMKILFGMATTEVTESLFVNIFADTDGKLAKSDLAELATQFAALVPENKFTPGEVQNFLLPYRNEPARAIDHAARWAEELLAAKSQGGNVASFEGQI